MVILECGKRKIREVNVHSGIHRNLLDTLDYENKH